jgi:FKBP-type peptidyl-prolyl cis-trans isomerase (trigger factor)
MKVVESMVGVETLRREAIDDALPKALAAAIAETDLRPVVYPPRRPMSGSPDSKGQKPTC